MEGQGPGRQVLIGNQINPIMNRNAFSFWGVPFGSQKMWSQVPDSCSFSRILLGSPGLLILSFAIPSKVSKHCQIKLHLLRQPGCSHVLFGVLFPCALGCEYLSAYVFICAYAPSFSLRTHVYQKENMHVCIYIYIVLFHCGVSRGDVLLVTPKCARLQLLFA